MSMTSERPTGEPPPAPATQPDDQAMPAGDERADWTREDDELLLLDELEEIDEGPGDDQIDDLV